MILFFRGRGYWNLSSPEVHWDQLNVSRYSLRASSLGYPGGKGRRACNYVSEFEYLHRRSRCEMLLGGDDISNDVITPITRSFTCFSMFAFICARFRFTLIGGNLIAQLMVYLTSSLRSFVRYRLEHEKIKFVSTRGRVIFCLLYRHRWRGAVILFSYWLRLK